MESVRQVVLDLLQCDVVTLFLIFERKKELRWASRAGCCRCRGNCSARTRDSPGLLEQPNRGSRALATPTARAAQGHQQERDGRARHPRPLRGGNCWHRRRHGCVTSRGRAARGWAQGARRNPPAAGQCRSRAAGAAVAAATSLLFKRLGVRPTPEHAPRTFPLPAKHPCPPSSPSVDSLQPKPTCPPRVLLEWPPHTPTAGDLRQICLFSALPPPWLLLPARASPRPPPHARETQAG